MATTLPGSPYVESSDLVANYPAVSESLAERVDLVGVLPFASAAARTTALPTPTDGQYSYLQDTNSTEFYNGAAWVVPGGKIMQIVRATDATQRTTSSVSFVDASISVTITPTKNTSVIILMYVANIQPQNSSYIHLQITDNSNNPVDGANVVRYGTSNATFQQNTINMIGYATPATSSAITYKVRFLAVAGTALILNDTNIGQLYAIEVAA